jgi:hypothetical protein
MFLIYRGLKKYRAICSVWHYEIGGNKSITYIYFYLHVFGLVVVETLEIVLGLSVSKDITHPSGVNLKMGKQVQQCTWKLKAEQMFCLKDYVLPRMWIWDHNSDSCCYIKNFEFWCVTQRTHTAVVNNVEETTWLNDSFWNLNEPDGQPLCCTKVCPGVVIFLCLLFCGRQWDFRVEVESNCVTLWGLVLILIMEFQTEPLSVLGNRREARQS